MILDVDPDKPVIEIILDKHRAPHSSVGREIDPLIIPNFAATSIIFGKKKRICGNYALAHSYDSVYRLMKDYNYGLPYLPVIMNHDDIEEGARVFLDVYALAAFHEDNFGRGHAENVMSLTDLPSMTMKDAKEQFGKPTKLSDIMRSLDRLYMKSRLLSQDSLLEIRDRLFSRLHKDASDYFAEIGSPEEDPLAKKFIGYFGSRQHGFTSHYLDDGYVRKDIEARLESLRAAVLGISAGELEEKVEMLSRYGFDEYGLYEESKAKAYSDIYITSLLNKTRDNIRAKAPYPDLLWVGKLADGLDNIRTMTPVNPYEQYKTISKTEERIDKTLVLADECILDDRLTNLANRLRKELVKQVRIRRNNMERLPDTRYGPNIEFLDDEYKRLRQKYSLPVQTLLSNFVSDTAHAFSHAIGLCYILRKHRPGVQAE
jgi:hypothetical protein